MQQPSALFFLFFFRRQGFSHRAAHAVDMPFKIAVADKFGQNELFKCRNDAGTEAEFFIESFYNFRLRKLRSSDGEIVSENVFRYMTLSRSASAKSVSAGFAETENSES